MADLGITVEFKPDTTELDNKIAALQKLEKIPVPIDAEKLTSNVQKAIKAGANTPLKIKVDTQSITSQVKAAIAAAGSNQSDNGSKSSKGSSGKTSTTSTSRGSAKSSTSSAKKGATEAEKAIKRAERQAAGLRQTMSYLQSMKTPVDSSSIKTAESAMKKFDAATKGTAESMNALKEAQQAINIAFSRNGVRAAEKAQMSQLNVDQIRSKFGKLKKGHIIDQESVKNLDSLLGKYRAEKDFTPAKYDLEKQIKKAWTTAERTNSDAAVQKAIASAQKQANMIQQIKNRGTLGEYDWSGYETAKSALDAIVSGTDQAAAGTNRLAQVVENLGSIYTEVSAKAGITESANTATVRTQRQQEHLANIYRQASESIRNNPKVHNSYLRGELEDIMKRAANPGDGDSVEGLQRDLAAARKSMEELGLTSETLGQRLTRLFKDHFNTAVAMAGLHLLQNSLQQVLQNVVDVDTAMTDLKKVSNGTDDDYANYLDSAASRAKDLGASMTDVIGATSEFSRLGYNLEDASNLGDWATKYMNVSEYTNIEDAAQSLVSTLQGFHLSADEVGSVVDRFNEIGNSYAISSEGLGEALKRSAAALAAGGNSLDESLGLITAANEVVDLCHAAQ